MSLSDLGRNLLTGLRQTAKPTDPAPVLTFCAHQYHCRECWENTAKLARSWIAKVEALERELARAQKQ